MKARELPRPTAGECQKTFNEYGIDSTIHTGTTVDLCAVIRALERQLLERLLDEDELLDCPFCGKFAKEEQTRGSFGGYRSTTVYCQNCGVSAPSKKVWNKRVDTKK